MEKKIKNDKTEVPKTTDMNDKDYLNDILEMEKNMCSMLAISLNEASNEILYKEFLIIFKEISNAQRILFEEIFKNGWYTLEEAEEVKIKEKHKEFKQQLAELI